MSLSVIAMRGYKGTAVAKIQKQLNKINGAKLDPDGVFGPDTEAAVKSFQKDHGFLPDGIVGPFTNAALSLTLYSRHLPTVPPHVHQGDRPRCWAAATASYLKSRPGRTKYTQEQIVRGMQEEGIARADGSLPVSAQSAWEDMFGLRPVVEPASSFFAEKALARLELERLPLLLGLGGSVGHVMVLFGVVVTGLEVEILVMDPLSASADHPVRRKVSDIQQRSGNVTTWMYKRPWMV